MILPSQAAPQCQEFLSKEQCCNIIYPNLLQNFVDLILCRSCIGNASFYEFFLTQKAKSWPENSTRHFSQVFYASSSMIFSEPLWLCLEMRNQSQRDNVDMCLILIILSILPSTSLYYKNKFLSQDLQQPISMGISIDV